MKQEALSIVAPVANLPSLLHHLGRVQSRVDDGTYKPLCGMPGLHFASFVVWEAEEESGVSPHLLFEANFDGGRDAFLGEWVELFSVEIDQIFRHCHDYPATVRGLPHLLRGFLDQHDVGPGCWYQGHTDRSVGQIRREEQLRGAAGEVVDEARREGSLESEPQAVLRRILHGVRERGLGRLQLVPDVPFRVRHGRRILGAAGGLALAGLVALGVLALFGSVWPLLGALGALAVLSLGGLAWLRLLSRSESSHQPIRATSQPLDKRRRLAQREDRRDRVQNHMVSYVRVKQGPLRLATLRAVLAAIGFLGRWWYNRGALGSITTIHFARWLILERGGAHWLVFFSNYDGSWDSYLDDFVDLAAVGLTGIWSNTEGFPRTRLLFCEGARDGARFKAWARRTMGETQVWYSAYPRLTVAHVNANTALRKDLFREDLSEAEVDAVLRRI